MIKIRNSKTKSETISKNEFQKLATRVREIWFAISIFEIVSDFDIRFSNLRQTPSLEE